MKPFEQWSPDELVANIDAAIRGASARELIAALSVVQGSEGPMEEVSRRQLIRLLAARLAVATMKPEYIEGASHAGKG